jgi:hypothetical protein
MDRQLFEAMDKIADPIRETWFGHLDAKHDRKGKSSPVCFWCNYHAADKEPEKFPEFNPKLNKALG